MPRLPILLPLLAAALGLALPAPAQVDAAARSRIDYAVPAKAPATPREPRRVLLYTRCTGFVHSSIPYGVHALSLMGERTGAYEAVASDDPAMFEPGTIEDFDAVVLLSTTGNLFLPQGFGELDAAAQAAARDREGMLKESFMDWLRDGGGLVGIHAATDVMYDWEEYGEAIGGYFDGHPWNSHQLVNVRLEDRDHPVNAPLHGMDLEIVDEIYQIKSPYDRMRQRVLLALDTNKTDMTLDGIKRVDHDFPVSWVKRHGQGRVYYNSLGHREDIYERADVLAHYLHGLQWAMGDLAGDDAPSATLRDADGFQPLFNGVDMAGWRMDQDAWEVLPGGIVGKGARRGDLWTDATYGDFILEAEFMMAEGTNSGIFFRTSSIEDYVQTGIEVQVYDSHGVETTTDEDCGAIFDIMAPSSNAAKPAGEWNHCRIEAVGPLVKVDLNGTRVIDIDLDDWTEAGKNPGGEANKFSTAFKDMARRGHIGLQDHGKPVWFRNARIKALD